MQSIFGRFGASNARSARPAVGFSSGGLFLFSLDNQLREREAKALGNALSCIQIGASLSPLQKPDIGLMETGHSRQGGAAESFISPMPFNDCCKAVR